MTITFYADTGCKGTYIGAQWLQPKQCSLAEMIIDDDHYHGEVDDDGLSNK